MDKAIDCSAVLNGILVPVVVISPKWNENELIDFRVEYSNKACLKMSTGLFSKDILISTIVKNDIIKINKFITLFKNLEKQESSVVSFFPEKNPRYLIEVSKMQDGKCVLLFNKIASKTSVLKNTAFQKSCKLDENTDLLWRKLTSAILGKSFELFFQPQYSIENDSLRGFEALIRWNDHELGQISPEYFIPIAEKSNYIVRLGWWILETALVVLKTWQLNYNFTGILSVNLSAIQMCEENFLTIFTSLLNTYNVNPNSLEIEITESVLVDDMDTTRDILNSLSKQNVLISIDDFGAGYSSFKYLQMFPVNTLKIDKSLIDDITDEDLIAKKIINTIVTLGKELGFEIIAEGVEDENQLSILNSMHCETVQGYLRGRPVERAKCEAILKEYA